MDVGDVRAFMQGKEVSEEIAALFRGSSSTPKIFIYQSEDGSLHTSDGTETIAIPP